MFAYPWWLLGLLVSGLVALGYVLLLRRRRRDVMLFTNLALLERIAPARPGWPRHLPVIGLILASALLFVGLAGPQANAKVPRNRATVILVIDVSLSMRATDVQPTRLAAAQTAAKQFVDDLTPGVNLGLVSFSGTAAVLVSPTTDRDAVKRSVDGLTLGPSTATGDAITAALQSIQNFSGRIQEIDGSPIPATVVLMSDGAQTVPNGPDAENQPRGAFTAARNALKAGVPVSTISFGTPYGAIDLDGSTVPVAVDDDSLRKIAEISTGQFFTASSVEQLKAIYSQLGEQIGYETELVDIGRPFIEVAAALLVVATLIGLATGRRIP